jgi:hypothetical protein
VIFLYLPGDVLVKHELKKMKPAPPSSRTMQRRGEVLVFHRQYRLTKSRWKGGDPHVTKAKVNRTIKPDDAVRELKSFGYPQKGCD